MKLPTMPVLLSIGCLGIAATGTIFSPALYHAFANAAGFEGHMTVSRPIAPQPGEAGPPLTVRFDTNVMPGLDWDFAPEHPVIEAQIGVPTVAYFNVKNRGNAPVVARAIFNVTPDPAAYHFMKMDSFCCKNESLAPGESVRVPVVFFFDRAMLDDPEMVSIRTLTVSYSFFPISSAPAAVSLGETALAEVRALATQRAATFSADPDK
jgi:cytochrome c oxidase assembly protein subunit 11